MKTTFPSKPKDQVKELRNNLLILMILGGGIVPWIVLKENLDDPNLLHLIVICIGSTLFASVMSLQPISPFRYNLFKPRFLTELGDEERRVLTFLNSKKANLISLILNFLCSILFILTIVVKFSLENKSLNIAFNLDWYIVSGIIASLLLLSFALYFIQLTCLFFLVHAFYERIVLANNPWSLNKKFPNVPFETEKPRRKTKIDKIYDILYIIFAFLVLLLYLKYRGKI